ncbi:prepilin peptidase [Methylobacterium sp. JK268]
MIPPAAEPVATLPPARRAGRWILPLCLLLIGPALWLGPAPVPAAALVLALLLATAQVVWQDVASLTIADGAVLAIGLAGAVARLPAGGTAGEGAALLLDALLGGGAIWLVREAYYRRRGHDGIGLGDVKLSAAGGLLVGPEGFAWALLLASLAGLALVGIGRLRARPLRRTDKIPFGALLAPALLAIWLWAGPP